MRRSLGYNAVSSSIPPRNILDSFLSLCVKPRLGNAQRQIKLKRKTVLSDGLMDERHCYFKTVLSCLPEPSNPNSVPAITLDMQLSVESFTTSHLVHWRSLIQRMLFHYICMCILIHMLAHTHIYSLLSHNFIDIQTLYSYQFHFSVYEFTFILLYPQNILTTQTNSRPYIDILQKITTRKGSGRVPIAMRIIVAKRINKQVES